MKTLHDLKIAIYADGADIEGMARLAANPLIKGLTTNPTLMRKAGIRDYEAFAKEVLARIPAKPISFEVFSDEFPEMRRQALKISSWQSNVFVKIPITNTRAESSIPLIHDLAQAGVQLNVTAVLAPTQIGETLAALNPAVPSILSVFAGRIADTGRDPVPVMSEAVRLSAATCHARILWASVREVLNIFQADAAGCDIVTVPHDILDKALKLAGMDLAALSLDTVQMFARDATAAGFAL